MGAVGAAWQRVRSWLTRRRPESAAALQVGAPTFTPSSARAFTPRRRGNRLARWALRGQVTSSERRPDVEASIPSGEPRARMSRALQTRRRSEYVASVRRKGCPFCGRKMCRGGKRCTSPTSEAA